MIYTNFKTIKMKTTIYTNNKTLRMSYLTLVALLMSQLVLAQDFTTPPVSSPFGFNGNVSDGVYQPTFADIDNDGDYDLLMGRSNSSGRMLELYENIGDATNPHFATPVMLMPGASSNPPNNSWVFLPSFADLDDDGDFDLLVGRGDYTTAENFEYYENLGTAMAPTFTTTPFLQTIPNAHAPAFIDLEGDGDFDVFLGGKPDYTNPNVEVQYHENQGTASNPSFVQVTLSPPVTADGAAFPATGDLNLDGYPDLILGDNTSDIKYYTNDGAGNFTAAGILVGTVTPQQSPALVDIDGDGDLDLFIGTETSLDYYKNTDASAAIEDYSYENIEVYPNPTNGILNIRADENIQNISLFDVLGKQIMNLDSEISAIDLGTLKTGIYILKVSFDSGIYTVKRIVKQ